MGRAESISDYVRIYDPKLYCEANAEGKLCVFREGHAIESFALNDQDVLHYVRPNPHFVFAITHNWKKDGRPVEWGKLKIWERLRQIDLWERDLVSEIEKQEEQREASCERQRKNQTEDFLHEFRDGFKKTFSDVNTANMDKKKDLRRIKEK